MDLSDLFGGLTIFSGFLTNVELLLTIIILTLIVAFIYISITDESEYNQACKINSILYEKLRSNINDVNAVALFDFMLADNGLLIISDIQYLMAHTEKPVTELAKSMICETTTVQN